MNKNYVIAPLLTLPTKAREEAVQKPVKRFGPILLLFFEALYLLVAVEIGYVAFFYFAPWPIYRIVAFVVLFILWSNCASALVRRKSIDKQPTKVLSAAHLGKQELSLDTTAYLVALRKTFE